MTARASVRRLLAEDGVVGGIEVLPFGLLVFVIGTLLLVNVWGVIDGRLAAGAAAREAARAYVESPGPAGRALDDARRAAITAFDGQRVATAGMTVEPVDGTAFVRCATATFEVTYRVPAIRLPVIGGLGGAGIDVKARHSEVVDPYRDGVPAAGGVAC